MSSALKEIVKRAIGPSWARSLAAWWRNEEPHFGEAELIAEVFSKGGTKGVMVDVGAHFGESLLPYLSRGWEIFAFEPDPANRAELEKVVPVSQIRLFDVAVGDREEDGVPFFASDESSGISGLSAFRDSHREVRRVKLTTLKSVLASDGVNRVDFLKIDTEGHDLFVLKGFPWDRLSPDVVLCEFEDYKTLPLGYGFEAMGNLLLEKGYQVYLSEWAPIRKYGVRHEWRSWRKYPCGLQDSMGWGNFVAFSRQVDLGLVQDYLRRFPKRAWSLD